MRRAWAPVLILLFCAPAAVSGQALLIDRSQPEVRISGPAASFLRDPGGDRSTAFVAGLPETRWTASSGATSFGYTSDVIWLRARIRNESNNPFLYLTEHHGIDEFMVYQRPEGSTALTAVGTSGWAPELDRPARTPNPGVASLVLRSAPGTETELFIRIRSSSSLNPRFIVMDSERYIAETRSTVLIQGLASGLAMTLLILSFLMHLAIRGRITGYYVALTSVALMLILYTTGLGPLVVWIATPAAVPWLGRLATGGTLAMSVVFIRAVLITPEDQSLLGRVFRVMQWVALALLGVALLFPARIAFPAVTGAMGAYAPALFGVLAWALFQRRRYAGALLVSWSMLLLVALTQGLVNAALVSPPRLLSNLGLSVGIGVALQNVILAGIIVQRTETIKEGERSRRKQAEATAHAAQEQIIVADRMRGLDYLVSGVTHELGNTIGAARQISELIRTEARWQQESSAAPEPRGQAPPVTAVKPADFAAAVEENAAFVEEQLSITADLVKSLKRVARDEARIQIETTDVCGLIQDIARSAQVSKDVKGPRHQILTRCQEPLMVTTSPGALTQILLNLVSNAVRHGLHGRSGGTVTISAETQPGPPGFPAWLTVSVRDNGSGVRAEVRDRIFDLYFTTAVERGGTGLGLSICRTLAEDQLGGTLTLQEPEPADGADTGGARNFDESDSGDTGGDGGQPGACFVLRIPVSVVS